MNRDRFNKLKLKIFLRFHLYAATKTCWKVLAMITTMMMKKESKILLISWPMIKMMKNLDKDLYELHL